ncbi:MAG: hypothetical protein GX804_00480 [Lentisphaerae bacterium]|nr:hypothetical protein [Lentisphaerota bacterium]
MITNHDLSTQQWTLDGSFPFLWENAKSMETGARPAFEVDSVPAKLPGSVQNALRNAGIIPDWSHGLNHRACEWVENRHWLFTAKLPRSWFAAAQRARLKVDGLDGNGRIYWNGKLAGRFNNAFISYTFDLPLPEEGKDEIPLTIIFETPPRWLGQFGRTSEMREWKTRFGYGWDWLTRLVQIGVYGNLGIEIADRNDAPYFETFRCYTDFDADMGTGMVVLHGEVPNAAAVRFSLKDSTGKTLACATYTPGEFENGISWNVESVRAWWPNGYGDQPLYSITAEALSADDVVHDKQQRTTGFRRIEWLPCKDAPVAAAPWLCVINNTPVFLQGINWTPLQTNFADLSAVDGTKRVNAWRDTGMNTLRIWGGAVLESAAFYDACDRAGMLVWQDLPLSSSGIDNHPPDDALFCAELADITRCYVTRRQHHPSLLLWCGGNELQTASDGSPGIGRPLDERHPALRRAGEVIGALDPFRRYLPTSSSGPMFYADPENYGKGLHWDVHGPWSLGEMTMKEWCEYWNNDDALFRSETGVPGASSPDLIRRYAGGTDPMPVSLSNPLWRRTSWWIENDAFAREHNGRQPDDLEEYCSWSQARQAEALVIALRACKGRFPRCGGFLVWMGHDVFHCCANTAIMEFDAAPKPALEALRPILQQKPGPGLDPGQ